MLTQKELSEIYEKSSKETAERLSEWFAERTTPEELEPLTERLVPTKWWQGTIGWPIHALREIFRKPKQPEPLTFSEKWKLERFGVTTEGRSISADGANILRKHNYNVTEEQMDSELLKLGHTREELREYDKEFRRK